MILEFVILDAVAALTIAVAFVHLQMCRRDRAQLTGAHRRLGTLAPIAKADISAALARPDDEYGDESDEGWDGDRSAP